jgi:peroxiredoxin
LIERWVRDVEDKPDPVVIKALATQGPLSERLALIADDYRVRFVDYTRAMDRLVARLNGSGAMGGVPDMGDVFPDFILPDARGRLWRLADALERGPVVLAFHRGYWCDFCHLNMKSLAEISPRITELGSQIVAISPQNATHAAKLMSESGAEFPVLCDIGLGVSTLLGLSYVIDDDLQRELMLLEVDLNAANDGHGWLMPITATFVLNGQGVVAARHLDPDPRTRMDAEAIIQAAVKVQSAARS